MITKETRSVPVAMEKVRGRLERWRRTRAYRRAPIPAGLWAAAVTVARRHGLYLTARTLRLDYTSLKKRLHAADERAPALASPTFVELAPLPLLTSPCDCVIEIEAPSGGRMRVQVKGVPDLVALSRAVWSSEA